MNTKLFLWMINLSAFVICIITPLIVNLDYELYMLYSCLIARNLMNGLKTCWEVFQYMNNSGNKLFSGAGDGMDGILEGGSNGDCQEIMVSVCFSHLCFALFSLGKGN